jgi:ribonuclease HI
MSYFEAFQGIKNLGENENGKGKQVVDECLQSNENAMSIRVDIWKKPNHGWTKLNTDASFLEADGLGAWGAILRDDSGGVIMSAWGPIAHCPNVVTAEALGLLYGLRAALPLYAGPIQVESDNSFLVNEVKRNESSKSLIARHQNHHDFVPKLSCVQNKQEGELCCRWSGKRRV